MKKVSGPNKITYSKNNRPNDLIEQKLMRRVKRRDHEAFQELYNLTIKKIKDLCFHMMKDRSEAEDAAQNAYLKVWSKAKQFKGESKVYSWIYAIARNECFMIKRQKMRFEKRRDHLIMHDEGKIDDAFEIAMKQVPCPYALPDQQIANSDEIRKVQRVINKLNEHERAVFWLRTVQGFPVGVSAKFLGVTIPALKSRHYRSIQNASRMLLHKIERPRREVDRTLERDFEQLAGLQASNG